MQEDFFPDTESRIALTRRPTNQPVVMRQQWDHLLFLHWSVPAAILQDLLPPGLLLDTYEGNAYIGLVPFTMRKVRPNGFPAVRGLSDFHEVNVRTYVYAADTRRPLPGVWFFSLDAANLIAVRLARALFHLPYYFASMILEERVDRSIRYTSTRIVNPQENAPQSLLRYTPVGMVAPARPGTLEHFLCERYLLYSQRGGQLYTGRVYHTPYPLQGAVLHEIDDSLIQAAGIGGVTDTPPMWIHYATTVSVEVFPLLALSKSAS